MNTITEQAMVKYWNNNRFSDINLEDRSSEEFMKYATGTTAFAAFKVSVYSYRICRTLLKSIGIWKWL